MKRTQKQQLAYLKENEYKFAVYTFENGLRKEGYIALGTLEAFEYISRCLAKNLQVILTFEEDSKYITNEEYYHSNKRCSYEFCKKYEVHFMNEQWVRRVSSEYPF